MQNTKRKNNNLKISSKPFNYPFLLPTASYPYLPSKDNRYIQAPEENHGLTGKPAIHIRGIGRDPRKIIGNFITTADFTPRRRGSPAVRRIRKRYRTIAIHIDDVKGVRQRARHNGLILLFDCFGLIANLNLVGVIDCGGYPRRLTITNVDLNVDTTVAMSGWLRGVSLFDERDRGIAGAECEG